MPAVVSLEKCDGCGTCIDVCPAEAIRIVHDWAVVDENECVDCETCVDGCPNGAISMD